MREYLTALLITYELIEGFVTRRLQTTLFKFTVSRGYLWALSFSCCRFNFLDIIYHKIPGKILCLNLSVEYHNWHEKQQTAWNFKSVQSYPYMCCDWVSYPHLVPSLSNITMWRHIFKWTVRKVQIRYWYTVSRWSGVRTYVLLPLTSTTLVDIFIIHWENLST